MTFLFCLVPTISSISANRENRPSTYRLKAQDNSKKDTGLLLPTVHIS
jgi:hypothetical protein